MPANFGSARFRQWERGVNREVREGEPTKPATRRTRILAHESPAYAKATAGAARKTRKSELWIVGRSRNSELETRNPEPGFVNHEWTRIGTNGAAESETRIFYQETHESRNCGLLGWAPDPVLKRVGGVRKRLDRYSIVTILKQCRANCAK